MPYEDQKFYVITLFYAAFEMEFYQKQWPKIVD